MCETCVPFKRFIGLDNKKGPNLKKNKMRSVAASRPCHVKLGQVDLNSLFLF